MLFQRLCKWCQVSICLEKVFPSFAVATYLRNRLHFDFILPSGYASVYNSLIGNLYSASPFLQYINGKQYDRPHWGLKKCRWRKCNFKRGFNTYPKVKQDLKMQIRTWFCNIESFYNEIKGKHNSNPSCIKYNKIFVSICK